MASLQSDAPAPVCFVANATATELLLVLVLVDCSTWPLWLVWPWYAEGLWIGACCIWICRIVGCFFWHVWQVRRFLHALLVWPLIRQAKHIPFSFKNWTFSVCCFAAIWWQDSMKWFPLQKMHGFVNATLERFSGSLVPSSLSGAWVTTGVIVVAKLFLLTVLCSGVFMLLAGDCWREPNTGSNNILDCLSTNSTTWQNLALLCVSSCMFHALTLHLSCSLNGNFDRISFKLDGVSSSDISDKSLATLQQLLKYRA